MQDVLARRPADCAIAHGGRTRVGLTDYKCTWPQRFPQRLKAPQSVEALSTNDDFDVGPWLRTRRLHRLDQMIVSVVAGMTMKLLLMM